MSVIAPDLEPASAQEVLAYGVQRFGPRLTMACSFQKEESVLLHMLTQLTPEIRAFTIDTGVLFGETLETQKRFEDRFGVELEVFDARRPGEPWTAEHCCAAAKVEALERGLSDVDAWVTGIRLSGQANRGTRLGGLSLGEARDRCPTASAGLSVGPD